MQPKELAIIVLAMLIAAPAVYIVMVYLMYSHGRREVQPNSLYIYVLLAIASLQLLLVPLIERVQVAAWRAGKRSVDTVSDQVRQMTIVRLAQIETVYIFGIVIFFATWDYHAVYYFYALGIVASILYWPTRAKLDQLAHKLEMP